MLWRGFLATLDVYRRKTSTRRVRLGCDDRLSSLRSDWRRFHALVVWDRCLRCFVILLAAYGMARSEISPRKGWGGNCGCLAASGRSGVDNPCGPLAGLRA